MRGVRTGSHAHWRGVLSRSPIVSKLLQKAGFMPRRLRYHTGGAALFCRAYLLERAAV